MAEPAFSRTAVDGTVVTVDRDEHSWAVTCTVCGFVTSDPDDQKYAEEVAEHHEGWHEAEYERARRCLA